VNFEGEGWGREILPSLESLDAGDLAQAVEAVSPGSGQVEKEPSLEYEHRTPPRTDWTIPKA